MENSDRRLEQMLAAAVSFHGEQCRGVALGAKIMEHVLETWRIEPKDPRLKVWVGNDGCIADALQAISGATLGNGRFKVPGGRSYRLVFEGQGLSFHPKDDAPDSVEVILKANFESLFAVRQDPAESAREHTKSARHRLPIAPQVELEIREKVQSSLVENKLPCAVAYKIAADMHIFVGEVGQVADDLGLKISRCQLGCFN